MIIYILLTLITGFSCLLFYLYKSSSSFMLRHDCIAYEGHKIILMRYNVENWTKVTAVIAQEEVDVTAQIIFYAGRDRNFYHIKTPIKLLIRGCDKLIFTYEDSANTTFIKYIEF